MDHQEVGEYWERNANAWSQLVRAGCDLYRDHLNTPAFFRLLPDVAGLHGVDLGCGEGANSRLLAERGAHLTAIDIAPTFVQFAMNEERKAPLGIHYQVASMEELPFEDAQFDFSVAFMSMMDVPDLERALREVYRVLRAGGFFQFSITHPCFNPPHRRNLRGVDRVTYAIEVGKYFQTGSYSIDEWIFGSATEEQKRSLPKFRIPVFHRTLTDWFQLLMAVGFQIEAIAEPCPTPEQIQKEPGIADSGVVAYFLLIRARKP